MLDGVLGKTMRCAEDEGEAAGLLIVVQSGEGGAKPKEAAHHDVDYRKNNSLASYGGVYVAFPQEPNAYLIFHLEHSKHLQVHNYSSNRLIITKPTLIDSHLQVLLKSSLSEARAVTERRKLPLAFTKHMVRQQAAGNGNSVKAIHK